MLKPLNDNVILKKEKAQKQMKTASGIILGDNKNVPSYASVEAIGPECKADIHVNERVVYKEYSGTNVELHDDEFVIVAEEDILAVVTAEKE